MAEPVANADHKLSFEEALNQTGFGLYSILLTLLSGCIIISYLCISYGTTIIIPTSACELQTTGAQKGIIAAAPLTGIIFGSVLWGYMGDKYGRRNTIIVSLIAAATVNALASISVNWIMMTILLFIASVLTSGQYSLAMTLVSESVPASKRDFAVLLVASFFLLSKGIMSDQRLGLKMNMDKMKIMSNVHVTPTPVMVEGTILEVVDDYDDIIYVYLGLMDQLVLAMPIIPMQFSYYLPALGIHWNSWRTVMLVYSIPSVMSAVCMYFMQESPKFMYAKGQIDVSIKALKTIHRINNFMCPSKDLDLQIKVVEADRTGKETSSLSEQIASLFKPPLLKYTVIMATLFVFQQLTAFIIWLPTIANQYSQMLDRGDGLNMTLCGIIEASIKIPPNPHIAPCALNESALLLVLGVGGAQSIANAIIAMLVNHTGRRNMVIAITFISGISGLLINEVPNAIGSGILFLIFLLGFLVLGLYTAITVAMFPTELRALAVSLTMTGGRVMSLASVQVLNYLLKHNCEAGFYTFGSLITVSALISALLPDDRKLLKQNRITP